MSCRDIKKKQYVGDKRTWKGWAAADNVFLLTFTEKGIYYGIYYLSCGIFATGMICSITYLLLPSICNTAASRNVMSHGCYLCVNK